MREYRSDCLIRPDRTFHIFFSTETQATEAHTHDFIEIIYISDGHAIQTINGIDFEVGRGDLLFMNYGCTHAFSPQDSLTFYNICFRPKTGENTDLAADAFSLLQTTAFEQLRNGKDTGLVSFRGEERDEMENLLSLMLLEGRVDAPFGHAVLESYMSILLVKTLREAVSSPTAVLPSNRELSDYIDSNLGADLTLSALSQRYFYNPSYFSRMFKSQFGIPLTEYIEKRRIAMALRLLKETEMTVEQVAFRVGYSSKTSFYRAFSKITGATPSYYRQQRQSSKGKKTGM